MIISKKVLIRINSRNFQYYKNIVTDIKNNNYFEIDVSDLMPSSHTKIQVKCYVCESLSHKPYRQYLESLKNKNFYCCSPKCAQVKNNKTNIEKYGVTNVFQSEEIKKKIKLKNLENHRVEYPSQSEFIREKSKITWIENYGFDNPAKSQEIKEKMKDTSLLKYGTESYNSSELAKVRRIEKKIQIPDVKKTEFEIFRNKVRNETKKLKKKLFENWNGLDFYDGEQILNYLNLPFYDKKYPTIDHKISIHDGFTKGMSVSELCKIENLCITKRWLNASKNIKSV